MVQDQCLVESVDVGSMDWEGQLYLPKTLKIFLVENLNFIIIECSCTEAIKQQDLESRKVVNLHQPRLDACDKCWGLVHWEDPEESGGEGGGRGDQDGKYM